MTILRTIIRFAIILIFLILLVLLSITLFKLIPKAVNQLATASVSITSPNNNSTTSIDRTPQPVATTTGGLNGVITQSLGDKGGDIVIMNKTNTTPSKPIVNTNYSPKPTYSYNPPVYYPTIPQKTGLKNIKVALTSIGVIDQYTGAYRVTNNFNTNDTVFVKYTLSNTGDTDTGPFSMRVDMPAQDPNDAVRYLNNIDLEGNSVYAVEARFNGINTTVNPTVNVYADVNNQVVETNKSDNTLTVNLNNVVNNNNYNNNNNNSNNSGSCYYANGIYYNCGTNNNNNNNNGNCYYSNGNYICPGNNNNANLTVVQVQTGKTVNGIFYPQTNFTYGDQISIQATIRNNGGSYSNNWSARATVYNSNGSNRNYDITNQSPIAPGSQNVYTFQTDTIAHGNATINVTADNANNVYETNEGDNTATQTIYVN